MSNRTDTRLVPVDRELAGRIYDLLIEKAGAVDDADDKDDFVYWLSGALDTRLGGKEYRFMGRLGFGGKFWWHVPYNLPGRPEQGQWYVTCYPEDSNPEREQIVADTNAALLDLYRAVKIKNGWQ
ncbi:hypothetical protein [Aeromicrobium sp. 179-A 4D2 NHS]|uniref:hypothetical protein n=1 Tax=Aeromicrobium sp. 179-A 4D2 NHS TaxID=3142375 RepID=UPI0039A3F213